MTQKASVPVASALTPAQRQRRAQWVQTDRATHEAWARLIARRPRAAALMHQLVAQMDRRENTVVVSQKTLAKIMGVSDRTISRAVKELVEERWIEVVKLNGAGSVNAYRVNDRVAWGQRRDQLHLSRFSATVVADRADQDETQLEGQPLRSLPLMAPGWEQLPSGPGEPPPSEPPLEGLEPDLPALRDVGSEFDAMSHQFLP
jgi:DNA-binding transcriptional MocR family regulator